MFNGMQIHFAYFCIRGEMPRMRKPDKKLHAVGEQRVLERARAPTLFFTLIAEGVRQAISRRKERLGYNVRGVSELGRRWFSSLPLTMFT